MASSAHQSLPPPPPEAVARPVSRAGSAESSCCHWDRSAPATGSRCCSTVEPCCSCPSRGKSPESGSSTPAGFYWKAADNTLVPFTLPDLQGLYTTILAQGWVAFQKRTTLKEEIAAATTIAAVQAIVWA
ncbi:DUF4376 domain-containing protein [Paraburkholderia sp. HP33-1]|uniref:DUF4376 domain-containing protein n=1 Tax=Paraburkholderia sp. HP33-1 TaxID=2883243 RepID=UPI002DD44FB5|nr:DUF4376 domain-containing protein [Paraburkholderia sp. HP33-1]